MRDVLFEFPEPSLNATFIRRPQRFLVEMRLQDNSNIVAYCANSGSMDGNLREGQRALIWDSADASRKRRFTWRAFEWEDVWVGVDTHLSNRIIEKALLLKCLPGLDTYDFIRKEVVLEKGVRIDFVLSGVGGECWVEVKSVNTVKNGVARYPDSITPRGVNQLRALTSRVMEGRRCIVVFLIQRGDAESFQISQMHHKKYAEALDVAVAAGVEIMPLTVSVCNEGFGFPRIIRFDKNDNKRFF